MRQPRRLFWIAAIATLMVGCNDDGPGGGPSEIDYGDTGALVSGYVGTGFASFGQTLDQQFLYLYFNESLAEGPWDCFTDGYCGLGGLTDQFGNITSVPDSFLFVSTANFPDDNSGGDVVVVSSGIVTKLLTITDPSQYDSLRVTFEWAMLTSRLNHAVHDDSIVVRVRTDTDSTRLFKVTTADLEGGAFPVKVGGCGQHAVILNRPITYPHCTDWDTATVDVTPYLDRTFALEFIASEGGQSLTDEVDEPTAFLLRKVAVEGGK
jgi:hypothetical protein